MKKFYRFAMRVMQVIMPLYYRIDVFGNKELPTDGGYLFVSNHRSMADPILIGIQNTQTQFCFLAKQELFEVGLIGKFLRYLGAIAIDRGAGDMTPLEELKTRLKAGQNAVIFPEGTRSEDGTLKRFRTGAALLVAQTGVSFVPVAIYYTGKLRFRTHIMVRYGQPIAVHCEQPDAPTPVELKVIRNAMSGAVAELLAQNTAALPAEQTGQQP